MVDKNALENSIRRLMQSPAYKAMSQGIVATHGLRLSEEVLDPEIEYAASLLSASGVSPDDIENMILGNDARLRKFCSSYIKAQPALDLGQEFNPDEEEPDDEPTNEEYDGHSQTFLAQYATLYLMLSRKPNDLLTYLKKIREPKAPRQAILLKKFFDHL